MPKFTSCLEFYGFPERDSIGTPHGSVPAAGSSSAARSWLNRFRRILTRSEKRADTYLAMLHLACGLITWRAANWDTPTGIGSNPNPQPTQTNQGQPTAPQTDTASDQWFFRGK